MLRRGFRRVFRHFSAQTLSGFSSGGSSRPAGGVFCGALFAWPAFFPLFAARHLDAAKVTELLLWILAFAAYVVLGLVILIRISRSVKERQNDKFDYGSEAEMFRSLYRRKLLSPEEYKIIRLRLRDRLVGEVLNRESVPSNAETENVPHMAAFGKAFRRRAPRGLKIVPASEDASPLGDTADAEALALLEKVQSNSKLFKKHKISSIVYTPPAFDPAEETPSGEKLEETCR
ncbi:MAG: hypothetical protein J6S42_03700 [Thermoguttaceae bacterium]|nr:hypothetical protein [Thermoguttaceae bacterium]